MSHFNEREMSGIICQDLCHDHKFTYIGQRSRDLESQQDKHNRAITFQRKEKSALYERLVTLHHRTDWDRNTILTIGVDLA